IRHIIVLMMENHSFDNHLGMLSRPGVDGFALGPGGRPLATNPYPDGRVQHAFAMPTTCQLASRPSQTWVASHVQDDGGRNDGFVRSASGPVAMGYWGPEDLPFYYSLAATFPVADRYFCSLLGQTYPNRRYLMAATSLGQVDDTRPGPTDYPPNGTIFDRLAAHRIPWRDYVSDLPTTALFPPLASRYPGSTVPIAQFFTDAAQGTLPGFAIVDPQFTATSAGPGEVGGDSEENPQNIAAGEAFAARVIRAVMSGPAWASTVLVWTFDEHGGYYDHVPPPAAVPPDEIPPAVPSGQAYDGFARYGFRVPAVVVSPWSRPGLVSHTVFDHTSILKLVETKWNLPSLTARDANATSLSELLDPGRPAFLTPPSLAQPKLATDPGVLSCNATGPGTIPPPGSVS
ncbi:MAG TPA: alkaline phosphatase family protein, partial [Acidimicrobiales bacterium]|nr:alkaline phosphatase family protein [Acidimicrobiales bacterium]